MEVRYKVLVWVKYFRGQGDWTPKVTKVMTMQP